MDFTGHAMMQYAVAMDYLSALDLNHSSFFITAVVDTKLS
jgi:hypothetical protein